MKKLTLLCIVLLCCSLSVSADDWSFTEADFTASVIETPELMQQGPTVVGEEIRVKYNSPAVLRASREARLVWSEEIHFPFASYIAPRFGHMDLPAGAHLVVRSANGERVWEYRAQGKGRMGTQGGFWGIHVPGDLALVELYSNASMPAGAVVIESYARGFASDETGVGYEPEALCGADDSEWAQCYENSEPTIYDKSRAVARLLINGTSACTGWLVGSEGHLMTNEHCIGSSNAANNTNYEFMAEGACNTNCAAWFACPGTVVASSATMIQNDSALDYTLVKLPTNPTGTYGFMQMRASGAVVDERIYIPQHAAGWGKRIGVTSGHNSDGSGFCEVFSTNQNPCSGGPGDVGYYCDTQGGSSGSPVLGHADNLVVALHHCANCPNRGVPVGAIIADLGNNVPADAVVGDGGGPTCAPSGGSCSTDGDCCSNKCKGKPGNRTCR